MSDQLSKAESRLWQAKPIMAGYFINGYLIARGDEEPIARTICRDEADDEEASELIVSALNSIESAAAPVEADDEILAWRFDYCGTHTLVWLNRPADAPTFTNVTPLVDARYASTLARQLAESEEDRATARRAAIANEQEAERMGVLLAAATQRVAEVETALRGLLDYAELGDITQAGRSFAEVKAAARATLQRNRNEPDREVG